MRARGIDSNTLMQGGTLFAPNQNPPLLKFLLRYFYGKKGWKFLINNFNFHKNSPLERCEIFWREISNKCYCGNILTPPKLKTNGQNLPLWLSWVKLTGIVSCLALRLRLISVFFTDGLPRAFSLFNSFSYFTLYMYNTFHFTNHSAIEEY